MQTTTTLMQQLVCLRCRNVLTRHAERCECPGCGEEYPVVDGIPVILPAASRVVHEIGGKRSRGLLGAIKGLGARVLNAGSLDRMVTANAENMRFLRANIGSEATVLLAGGGIQRHGDKIELLGKELLSRTVNLDVAPGPVVDVVADGHDIPLPDGVFDLVISQAVLEHVRDPRVMVAEMTRVLKPGGWILVDVPFLWPIHMHSDFYRYTPMGLAELLDDFEAVKTGVNAGVASATALINTQFWASLLSFGRPSLYRKMHMLVRPLTTLVKYFDLLFRRWNLPAIAPASTYFIGRKPEANGNEQIAEE